MTASALHPILGGDDVADGVLAHLKVWMPTYLAEIARQRGLPADTFPAVKTWETQAAGQRMEEWDAPVISVVPIAVDEVRSGGKGDTLTAGFLTQVNAYVESTGQDATLRLATRYTAAVRAALLQHPTLGGLATGVEWVTETYRGVDLPDSRFRGGGACVVRVWVADVVHLRPDVHSPPADPLQPPPEAPLHTSSTVTVDRK